MVIEPFTKNLMLHHKERMKIPGFKEAWSNVVEMMYWNPKDPKNYYPRTPPSKEDIDRALFDAEEIVRRYYGN